MTSTRAVRHVLVAILIALGLAACTNDPFDPATVPNQRPTVRFFVEPVDSTGELNPTSYFQRTFHWSGSDVDGRVVAYFVSIRPDSAVPAPWDTTTDTDTTMSFTTDDEGRAQATVMLACQDDLGAVSDTLVRYIPLRNFPPALNFQSDFEPLVNLQREYVYDGDAVVDTTYWNWGVMNVRCFAFDLDGNATMDHFYRYTLADGEPEVTLPWDDPAADPLQHWLAVPFEGVADIYEFELLLKDIPPGERELTIAVRDEADAETRLSLQWEVRAPRGPLLVVPDNSGTGTRQFYRDFLAEYFGEGGWDEYDFWFGFPDDVFVLLETMRLFEGVFWFDGGSTSQILVTAADRDGALEQYLLPTDSAEPGKLLMISRNLTGTASGLTPYFRQTVLGVSPSGRPQTQMVPAASAVGAPALGTASWLPTMTIENRTGRGIGLSPLEQTEVLYQFAECIRCFGSREPHDPIIGVRRPDRATSEFARVAGFSFQLETMVQAEARAALAAVLQYELGVTAP
ncbi:MAG TPA: hypothetical protein PLL30_08795 [Candidatus Krumholzibacteria bacterium]|nr:hypothetical protein [Candidatus Krumholzibacteria bacterium]HPD71856.1 hypothetical protein [Candidatus Krumholzibacteria bacterium]HRY41211.1 hypothetical protein [Candidatus Krumholzibacteria bacterium]